MNRLSLIFVSLLSLSLALYGQERSAVSDFADIFSEGTVSFDYAFELKSEDIPVKGSGSASMCGSCYYLNGNGLEMWCDGKTRWTVDRSAKEACIESLDAESVDCLSNPAALLGSLGLSFDVTGTSEVSIKGKKVTSVSMVPAIEDTGLESAVLFLDGATPVRVKIATEDGVDVVFDISRFTHKKESDVSAYSFDIALLEASYVVTDLR